MLFMFCVATLSCDVIVACSHAAVAVVAQVDGRLTVILVVAVAVVAVAVAAV